MDYSRFNYVAQPGDNAYLQPKIGVYDYFAIDWATASLRAQGCNAGWPHLDRIAARQLEEPALRRYVGLLVSSLSSSAGEFRVALRRIGRPGRHPENTGSRESARPAHTSTSCGALLEVTEAAFIEVGEFSDPIRTKCRRFADDS